jgi:hypothetical protein
MRGYGKFICSLVMMEAMRTITGDYQLIKKPSNGPSKVIILNRVRVRVKDYQTTQRKT